MIMMITMRLPLEQRFKVVQEGEISVGCVGHRLIALEIGNIKKMDNSFAQFFSLFLLQNPIFFICNLKLFFSSDVVVEHPVGASEALAGEKDEIKSPNIINANYVCVIIISVRGFQVMT